MLQKQRGFVVALKEEKREREDGFVHQDSEHLSMMGECACVKRERKGWRERGVPRKSLPSLSLFLPFGFVRKYHHH